MGAGDASVSLLVGWLQRQGKWRNRGEGLGSARGGQGKRMQRKILGDFWKIGEFDYSLGFYINLLNLLCAST